MKSESAQAGGARRRTCGSCCLAVLLALIGCSKYESSVYGLVKLDGELLDHGTVKFAPTEPGPAAYGMIDDDGKYQMNTGRESGLAAGEYRVTVACTEETASTWEGPGPPPPGKPIVPPWYNDPRMSGLKFEVTPGRNEINLELKREPPEALRKPQQRSRR